MQANIGGIESIHRFFAALKLSPHGFCQRKWGEKRGIVRIGRQDGVVVRSLDHKNEGI